MRQILTFQRGDHLTAVTIPKMRIGTDEIVKK
jgi:hypothetical protein